jgi:proteasome lid subunit RPN8/RPN11
MASEAQGPTGSAQSAAAVQDASLTPVSVSQDLVIAMFEHALQSYPEECCGLLIGPAEAPPERAVRCTNVQSLRKSRGESDLDARHGFWMDEKELHDVLREAERGGGELRAVYHSHVDALAYLSQADLRGALGPDGLPLWPGVSQFVVSVWDDGVRDVTCFDWDQQASCYVGRAVAQVPA